MGLVDYSDSENEDDIPLQPPKRRRTPASTSTNKDLPPLPATFHDLYSSTVRTSTQDDPALHGGRKRIVPHVQGNWPAHVYLEWHPTSIQAQHLSRLIPPSCPTNPNQITSLLQNSLGVPLPLHISLSRPLTLRTEQKEPFLFSLRAALQQGGIRAFCVAPADCIWHPNELRTRWFYVLRAQRPAGDELRRLLGVTNEKAKEFGQPLLYVDKGGENPASDVLETGDGVGDGVDQFHLSIAWSLDDMTATSGVQSTTIKQPLELDITVDAVKVRIGQDVTSLPLAAERRRKVPGLSSAPSKTDCTDS